MDYPDSLKIRRKSVTSDGQGGQTETWTTSLSDVDCLMRQLSAEETILNEKLSKISSHRLYCSDIDVTISDILWVTKVSETLSEMFEIESLDQRREMGTGYKKHMEINLFIRD